MPPSPLSGDLIRCPAIQLGMGTHRIVVFPPVSQNLSGMAEVRHLRDEARALKEVVAEQTLELRLLKKSMIGDGGDPA